jgi:aspartokinase/homoserine dehydrogenase 1
MLGDGCVRIAQLGVGTIGRELIRRTLGGSRFRYVALGDTSGVIAKESAFTEEELRGIVESKEAGGRLEEYDGSHAFFEDMGGAFECCGLDAFVDVTDAQTFDLLLPALERGHVVTSNKLPFADVPYSDYLRLVSKAGDEGRILDFGTTAGAGLRIPDLVSRLGAGGIDRLTGCLSGTMNYVSQRLNEGRPLSRAVAEAMEPPRSYTEPDPRVDLGGEDFARKLVILSRLCGRGVERAMVEVEDLIPGDLMELPVEGFLESLPDMDPCIHERMRVANSGGNLCWYLGTADLVEERYTVGFEEIPMEDPISRARESDNVLKIFPSGWRRPVTVIGPGAGSPETVTGLMSGLNSVLSAVS